MSTWDHTLTWGRNLGGGGRACFPGGQILDTMVPEISKILGILGENFKIIPKYECFSFIFLFSLIHSCHFSPFSSFFLPVDSSGELGRGLVFLTPMLRYTWNWNLGHHMEFPLIYAPKMNFERSILVPKCHERFIHISSFIASKHCICTLLEWLY